MAAAAALGVTAYAGTPDYLATLLETADAQSLALKITRAAVSGGALFPSMREAYAALDVDARSRVDALLDGTGCEVLFA